MQKPWWAPLAGVAFLVVLIVSFIVAGEPPDADSPVREIVDHYSDNKDAIMVGTALSSLAAALLVFFAGVLRSLLAAAEGPGGVLSAVAFAGAVIVAVGAAIDGTIAFAIAEAAEDIEPSSVQALQALWDNDFLPIALGAALFMLASGLSIVRHGALPKWLGWAAIVIGVIGLTPLGFISFGLSGLWILVASVVLALRLRRAPA